MLISKQCLVLRQQEPSILQDVEFLPYGIGLWRILTEWIGGIGIIVIMLSLIPMVGGGGMALYSAEVAGPTKNKLSPRIKETSNILLTVYISLTFIYILSYHFAGMHWFDAICYGLTTAATGGLQLTMPLLWILLPIYNI